MTMTGTQDVAADAASTNPTGRSRRSWAVGRVVRLHLVSRRVPAALAVMLACAAVFQGGLRWPGSHGSLQIPLIIEAAAAAIVAVATGSPFGESERATGRWLPYLRLGAAVGLTAAAFAALLAGSTGAVILGGTLALLRNVAGIAGVGLLVAGVLGAGFSWIGPMAYLALAEEALSSGWHTPWMWPTRPPGDVGGAICAALLFGVGLTVIAMRGARVTNRE
jgi:hypothetical protein